MREKDIMKKLNCLLVYPRFTTASFWNYRATCELVGAKYPAAPLGLSTVAALMPQAWNFRLVDCNVEELKNADLKWADIVLSGGMIAQQQEHLKLIEQVKEYSNIIHIVGGPDPTSSPQLYQKADHLVLGEAEVTLPQFLVDFQSGTPKKEYQAGDHKANMTTSPIPRYDLLKFKNYLHVGVQFSRGCPFKCEFCDIIELFGRVPRVKNSEQLLAEFQVLYDLGYRGHVDIVDDNFIGNRKAINDLLPKIKEWSIQHRWPFEFSIEASMNLADDEKLLKLMQDVGFTAVFVGIETPDEETLIQTQKKQNTRRSIEESMHRIFRHGMLVNAGYIVGFDSEKGSVSDGILECIEKTSIPINMVGLLFALPNTQLTRRLKKEGRLREGSEVVSSDAGDQCLTGLNFDTKRPKFDILSDYHRIIEKAYQPKSFFDRVLSFIKMMDCSKKQLRIPAKQRFWDLVVFCRAVWALGIKADYRAEFWRVFFYTLLRNPLALRYSIALMGLYLHFFSFSKLILARIESEIDDQLMAS